MDGAKVGRAESADHEKTNEVSNEGSLAFSDSVEAKESTIGDRGEQKFNDIYYNYSSLFTPAATPASTNRLAGDGVSAKQVESASYAKSKADMNDGGSASARPSFAKTALTNAAVEEGQTDQSRKRPVVPVSSTVAASPANGWEEVSHRRKPKFRKTGNPLVGRCLLANRNDLCRERD
jgi:hypothetical protein